MNKTLKVPELGTFFYSLMATIYFLFATLIFVGSFLMGPAGIAGFLETGIVADIFLAGAADIVFAIVLGLLIHVVFKGNLSKVHTILSVPHTFFFTVFVAIIYLYLVFRSVSIFGPVFVALAVFFFMKNFLFVLTAKRRDQMIYRFKEVYGAGLTAMVFSAFLFMFLSFALGVLLPEEMGPFVMGLALVNVVTVYYITTGLSSICMFSEKFRLYLELVRAMISTLMPALIGAFFAIFFFGMAAKLTLANIGQGKSPVIILLGVLVFGIPGLYLFWTMFKKKGRWKG